MVNVPYIAGEVSCSSSEGSQLVQVVDTVITKLVAPTTLTLVSGPHAAGIYTLYNGFYAGVTTMLTSIIKVFMDQASQSVRDVVVMGVIFGVTTFACWMAVRGIFTVYNTVNAPVRAIQYVAGLIGTLLTAPAGQNRLDFLGQPEPTLHIDNGDQGGGLVQQAIEAVQGIAAEGVAMVGAAAIVAERQYCGRMTKKMTPCRHGPNCGMRH